MFTEEATGLILPQNIQVTNLQISYKSNFLTLIKKDFSKQAMQYFGFDVNA